MVITFILLYKIASTNSSTFCKKKPAFKNGLFRAQHIYVQCHKSIKVNGDRLKYFQIKTHFQTTHKPHDAMASYNYHLGLYAGSVAFCMMMIVFLSCPGFLLTMPVYKIFQAYKGKTTVVTRFIVFVSSTRKTLCFVV